MEHYILYCYKEWLKEKEGDLFKQIFKIPVVARVLFALLLAGLISLFVILGRSIYGKDDTVLTLILGALYIILCIITSIYTEKYQVKHSKISFEKYKEYCNDMVSAVLNNIGVSKDFIPTLIERFNKMSDEIDEKIKLKHEHLNKFMEMLLIPISVLLLGALLDKSINVSETLGVGLSGILMILLIYAVIFFILFVYDFVMKLPQGKYREFITDLQSFLDLNEYDENREMATVSPSSSNESETESYQVHS